MRRTHIPNFITIGRWAMDKKLGEPKSREGKIVLQVQSCLKINVFRKKIGIWGNREKMSMGFDEKNTYTIFYLNRTMGKG